MKPEVIATTSRWACPLALHEKLVATKQIASFEAWQSSDNSKSTPAPEKPMKTMSSSTQSVAARLAGLYLWLVGTAVAALAGGRLPAIFSDHMVL